VGGRSARACGGVLRQVAEPFLHDVYAATLAAVHLAVRDGDQVLYLERMMGRASVPILSSAGSRLPMHCTGVGKVLLAHAPQDVHARVFANLTRVTPYTIEPAIGSVDPAGSNPSRRRGEHHRGNVAWRMFFGRPRDWSSDDVVAAAIGVVVPNLKCDRQRLLGALQVAAHGIGRQL
jgi:hypothetical protein